MIGRSFQIWPNVIGLKGTEQFGYQMKPATFVAWNTAYYFVKMDFISTYL